jgi:hypothetical protein
MSEVTVEVPDAGEGPTESQHDAAVAEGAAEVHAEQAEEAADEAEVAAAIAQAAAAENMATAEAVVEAAASAEGHAAVAGVAADGVLSALEAQTAAINRLVDTMEAQAAKAATPEPKPKSTPDTPPSRSRRGFGARYYGG